MCGYMTVPEDRRTCIIIIITITIIISPHGIATPKDLYFTTVVFTFFDA